MSLNKCIFNGRLVADPEVNQTQSGILVARFRIAVDRRTKQGDERKADFIPCVAWRNNAEFLQKWFHKGDGIDIVGELQSDNYTDKTGQQRTRYEINVSEVTFVVGGKNTGSGANAQQTAQNWAPAGNTQPTVQRNANVGFQSGKDEDFAVIDSGEDLPF